MTGWEEYPLTGTGGTGQTAIRVMHGVLSPQLRSYRDLLVALPPAYGRAGARHPVIYLQDGQNLFDPDTSYGGTWGLAATLAAPEVLPLAPILVPLRPPRVHQDAVGQRDGAVGRRLDRIAHERSMRRPCAVYVQRLRKFGGFSGLAVRAREWPRRTRCGAWPGAS